MGIHFTLREGGWILLHFSVDDLEKINPGLVRREEGEGQREGGAGCQERFRSREKTHFSPTYLCRDI